MPPLPLASSTLFRPIPNDRPWRILLEERSPKPINDIQQQQQQQQHLNFNFQPQSQPQQQIESYSQNETKSDNNNNNNGDVDDVEEPRSQIQVLPPSSIPSSSTNSQHLPQSTSASPLQNPSTTSRQKLRHISDLGTTTPPSYPRHHQPIPPTAFLSTRHTPPTTPEPSTLSHSRSPSYSSSYPSPSTSTSPNLRPRLPPKNIYSHYPLSSNQQQHKVVFRKDYSKRHYSDNATHTISSSPSSTASPSSSSTSTPHQSHSRKVNIQQNLLHHQKSLPQPTTPSSRSRSDGLQSKLISYDLPIAEMELQPSVRSYTADDGPPSLPQQNPTYNYPFYQQQYGLPPTVNRTQQNDTVRVRPNTVRHRNASWNDADLSQMLHDHIDVSKHQKKGKAGFIKRVFRRMKSGRQKESLLDTQKRRNALMQPQHNLQHYDDFDLDDVNDTDSRFQMPIPVTMSREEQEEFVTSRRDSRLDEDYWTDELLSNNLMDSSNTKAFFAKRSDTDIENLKSKPGLRGYGREARDRLNYSDPTWKGSLRRRSIDMNSVSSNRPPTEVDESARLLRMCKSNINVSANRLGQWDDFAKDRRRGYRLKPRSSNMEVDRRGMDRDEQNELVSTSNPNNSFRRNVKSFNNRERDVANNDKLADQRTRPLSEPPISNLNLMSINNSTRNDQSCQSYASSAALSVSSISQVSRASS